MPKYIFRAEDRNPTIVDVNTKEVSWPEQAGTTVVKFQSLSTFELCLDALENAYGNPPTLIEGTKS